MPVMGSRRDLRCEIIQVGVMRRSAETRGWAAGLVGSEGTVIRRGMSWVLVTDMI